MLPRRRVSPTPQPPRRASMTLRVAPATIVALGLVLGALPAAAQQRYFPPAGEWETRRPEQVGMNAAKLEEAVAFAQQSASNTTPDLEEAHYLSFGTEPFGGAIGPFKERGPVSGVIVRGGYIVAEFGEPQRVDMTFSVTKSFLSTTVGLAYDRGLIRDLNQPVHELMAPVLLAAPPQIAAEGRPGPFGATRPIALFDTPHNRTITWDHLLRQVSDWEGTLWDKPEWADRPDRDRSTWLTRERRAPGSAYEYNDTRVNVLALAALNVWRRPLPAVLREFVMDPIGASPTWRWFGYENSWVVIDGQLMQSVSGGGHWGGGMFISARDQARFGLLVARGGKWGDRQIVSEEWLRMASTPTPAQPGYGFMNFYLNRGRERFPSAPETAIVHLGNGTNMVYADAENDIVIVARWVRSVDGIVERVLAAIEAPVPAGQR